MQEIYDVIVLGGGTAGTNAAREATRMGARVLLVYKPDLMNLCIERGCMPSKSLLTPADLVVQMREAKKLGIEFDISSITPNYAAIIDRKNNHVERFMKALRKKVASEPYDTIHGTASFLPNNEGITVKNGDTTTTYQGKRYVIATGTVPFVPPIEGVDQVSYLTSDDIMQGALSELPTSITIMGAGPIGLEFATFFNGLGSDVTVLERDTLLSRSDSEFGEEMTRMLQEQGITVRQPVNVTRVENGEHGIRFVLESNDEEFIHESEQFLIATGRTPCLDELHLENVGLAMERGAIVSCNEHMCTSNENIFAAGDVTRDLQILHVAEAEGNVAGYNAAVGSHEKKVLHKDLMMVLIFTEHPFAHVGLSERELQEQDIPYVSKTIRFPETGRAIVMGVEHGLWKLNVHRESGKILGSTILGPRADDLIHGVHTAMVLHADVRTLSKTFAYHPTLSEQFISLVRSCAHEIEEQ